MTKDEFKRRWESGDDGGGITFDDIADCAVEWGLFRHPKCCDINEVADAVLKAAGVRDHGVTENKYSPDFAWKMYNFVCRYKSGSFGEVTLQEALDKHFENFEN